MGRIETTFENLRRKEEAALIPFLTAGDPDLETTERIIHALVESGADLIELGFPFSDPMADGPTIQAASERSLKAGTTLAAILEMIRRIRKHTNVPIVLMGYYNPVLHFGPARFAREASAAGVDGLLLVDLPPEEAGEIGDDLRAADLRSIRLLSPTTPSERMRRIAAEGEGYLYYVSMTGVTGVGKVDAEAIRNAVSDLREFSPVPVAVGFGISTPEDAGAIARFSDAVVVGSALVKIIESWGGSPELVDRVKEFIQTLKAGMRGK